MVLLICISEFDSKENLPGPKVDKRKMIGLWKEMYGYRVTWNSNNRITKKDFMDMMSSFRNHLGQKDCDALIFVCSSHGTKDGVLCSDGGVVNYGLILQYFNSMNAHTMVGKPKIFMFDCCRGGNDPFAKSVPPRTHRGVYEQTQFHPDDGMSVLYATTTGYVALDEKEGGTLIRSVFEVFEKNVSHKLCFDDLNKLIQQNVNRLSQGSQSAEKRDSGVFEHIYFVSIQRKCPICGKVNHAPENCYWRGANLCGTCRLPRNYCKCNE
jgi:hypothetical protein